MENIQDWMVSIVVLVIGGGIAWGRIHNSVTGLNDQVTGIQRGLGKLDKTISTKIKSLDDKLDTIDNKVIENQPVLNHLHSEAYKIREKLESCSKAEIVLTGMITANKNNITTLKEDIHRRIDTVKNDEDKTVVDIYKQIDSVKFDLKDLSHK